LVDNQKRPISELYLTIINKGYTGYFNYPNNGIGLKQGWEFNLTKTSNTWWDLTNLNSNTNIQTSNYTLSSGVTKTFYYNQDLMSGDTIDGDFCEWNDFTQEERIVSRKVHKFTFNQNWFTLASNTLSSTNQLGYFYQPHNPIQIAAFSDYIEEGSSENVVGIPDYAYYSTFMALFRWRDLYPYGFVDSDGIGVDYPYMNNSHYPFVDTIFRITPEDYNIPNEYSQSGKVPQNITQIDDPLIDGCE